jgi:hypothetical protein
MKIFNKLKTLFKNNENKIDESDDSFFVKKPKSFETELSQLKQKLSDFLLTGKVTSGIVIERSTYKLTKNSSNLYKLEGEEKEGRTYSIAISTGSYLNVLQDKISGILQVEEAELNRAIQTEHSSLESFLNKFKNLQLNEKAIEAITGNKIKFHWKEILLWERFWKEQVLMRLSPNCIAILLVSQDDSFKKFFLDVASRKVKQIVHDELFYLNQGVSSEDSNPNTKNYDLPSFDRAYSDFKRSVEMVKKKRNYSIE